jgi:hypothetical protein
MEKKKTKGTTANLTERKSKKVARKVRPVVAAAVISSASAEANTPSEEDIARKAYTLWELRGKPFGSPDEDWYRAEHELHNGAF